MAEEEKKDDTAIYEPENIGEDLRESTDREVGTIAHNMADTAHEVGQVIFDGILSKLDKAAGMDGGVTPPPPPDVVPEAPPADKAHEAIKEAAEATAPPAPGTQTTLHDQLEQAKAQMAELGK